jgi:hypothetical protein
MPTDLPQIGLGATLGYSLTSGGTYTPFALLLSIDTSPTVGTVEVPLLSATAKIKLPTIFDAGEVSAQMAYNTADPAAVALQTLMLTPAMVYFKITYVDGGTHLYTGFVTGMPVSGIEQESLVVCDVTLTATGTVVYTPHI